MIYDAADGTTGVVGQPTILGSPHPPPHSKYTRCVSWSNVMESEGSIQALKVHEYLATDANLDNLAC